MARGVRMNRDWRENILAAWRAFAENRLGPAIADDARRYCPVDTGALRDSIEHHMNGDALIIKATGSDKRYYAAWIELGHRNFHPSTRIVGPEMTAPSPFLRPALWQVRNRL